MKQSPAAAPGLHPARMQQLKSDIHRQILGVVDLSGLTAWSNERLRAEVLTLAQQLVRNLPERLNKSDRDALVDAVMAEVFGLGPLEQFLHDPTVSDILVNGPHNIYVERYGRLEPTGVSFLDSTHLLQIIQRIAAQVGRRIDESSPMVDARLADGSRVNAIIPPLALDGPMLSIRRFGVRLGEGQLLTNGTLTTEMLTVLEAAVHSRINMIISGGTGAGKTTLLNVLSAYIPHDERLVSIEDA
ncbi:MAG: ATPase, T2SS/T4P/T4SS family, partial [Gemmataceae bacterium]